MPQLIVTAPVSLDDVMEGPGHGDYLNAGWTFKDVPFVAATYEIKGREQVEAGALLFGRRSYGDFAPVWPTRSEFEHHNALPCCVVPTTLETDDERWPATIFRSLEDVAALKETDGGPILVHGSAQLATTLADAGLVDRYHLLVFPLLLGAGKRLYSAADKDVTRLAVGEQELYVNGMQKLVCDVVP